MKAILIKVDFLQINYDLFLIQKNHLNFIFAKFMNT